MVFDKGRGSGQELVYLERQQTEHLVGLNFYRTGVKSNHKQDTTSSSITCIRVKNIQKIQ